MKKILPVIIIIFLAACVAWLVIGPDVEKETIQKYEQERKYHLYQIDSLKGMVVDLAKSGETIREKMKDHSLKFSEALKTNNEAYLKLKKKYNEINLSRANAQSLDSVLSRLYPD